MTLTAFLVRITIVILDIILFTYRVEPNYFIIPNKRMTLTHLLRLILQLLLKMFITVVEG